MGGGRWAMLLRCYAMRCPAGFRPSPKLFAATPQVFAATPQVFAAAQVFAAIPQPLKILRATLTIYLKLCSNAGCIAHVSCESKCLL